MFCSRISIKLSKLNTKIILDTVPFGFGMYNTGILLYWLAHENLYCRITTAITIITGESLVSNCFRRSTPKAVAAHLKNKNISTGKYSMTMKCHKNISHTRPWAAYRPPRGNFVHYDFLKLHYIWIKMTHVSPPAIGALLCYTLVNCITLQQLQFLLCNITL